MHRVIFIAWNYNFFSSFCSLFFGQFVSVQIINNKFNANCSGNATNEFLMKFLSIINWSAVTKNVMKITIFYQNRFVHIFVVAVCVFSCSLHAIKNCERELFEYPWNEWTQNSYVKTYTFIKLCCYNTIVKHFQFYLQRCILKTKRNELQFLSIFIETVFIQVQCYCFVKMRSRLSLSLSLFCCNHCCCCIRYNRSDPFNVCMQYTNVWNYKPKWTLNKYIYIYIYA